MTMARVASLYPQSVQPLIFKNSLFKTYRRFSTMQFDADVDYYKKLGVAKSATAA